MNQFDVCVPNATTVAALEELERGEGGVIQGPTGQLFDDLS
jgi:pyrroline-5-carboxylate reductase